MSIIQRIRDKGAWILFGIIALALIAFILQDGLTRRGSSFSNTSTVGKVNGVAIEKADFEAKIEMLGKGTPREKAISQLWSQEVNTIIIKQECDKAGLVCTSKELSEILFSENSPFRREFTDPQTGFFDVEKAKQAFAQIKKSKNDEQKRVIYTAYIEPTIQQTLVTKYQNILQHAAYVPKWMIEKQQADDNAVSSVSYVYVPYSSVQDMDIKVSDDEIMAYAKKHKKEYEKDEESRTVSFVSFDVNPSDADSAAARTQVENMKQDFIAATDMKKYFAKTSSEMQYYDSYISKNDIKQPSKDSLFKLSEGKTYGPYVDGNDYVIAKMIGIKQWPDSAKVRHILVATHQQDQNTGSLSRIKEDTTAKKTIDSVEQIIKAGVSFDSVCLKYSDDGNKAKGGVYDYFPTSKMVAPFNDFAFDKPVGAKGIIQTDYGYHYVEVLGHKGSSPAYKIAYLAKPINISNETFNAASTAAAQLAATSKNKKQFEDNAIKLNRMATPSEEIKENDAYVTGLGESRAFVRWIYDHSTGDITEQPIDLGNKYVVAIVTSVNKPGLPSVQVLRPQIENLVKNEKKAKKIIEEKFKGSDLNAYANTAGVTVQKADSILFSNAFVPGVGNEYKFIGAAFNQDMKGKTTPPIAGTSGVYAIRVENISERPSAGDEETVRQTILQGGKMALYQGMNALKKAAVIKDYRSKFY